MRFLLPEELRRYKPDLVVWHRVSMPDMRSLDELEDVARESGTRLVYDLDDNLLDLDNHGEKGQYRPMTAIVRRSLVMADEVWSSTPRLAERLRLETTAAIEVLPNALDPVLWQRPTFDSSALTGPLRMLYMGTRTHDQDFALIAEAFCTLHCESPGQYGLTLIGATTTQFGARPWLSVMDPPAHVGASYPAFVHWLKSLQGFDLGLAPLLHGDFNDCKSSIKVLDYAALGLPTLASRVPAYSYPLIDGADCILTENSPGAWVDSIRSLCAQRTKLRNIAANASALVSESVFLAAAEARLRRLLSVNAAG
jgi:glycosyltransferase involved in cell wall biosynthesis